MRITVIGFGYLGATHAAAMADLGHEVLGMEIDREKREALARGEAPMYEPQLDELLARTVASGQLRFTDSYAEVAAFGEVHFVCVGTPQQPERLAADVSQVESAISGLAPHLDRPTLVVGKSTVPVGTAESLADILREQTPGTGLVWNPEFLREGHAVGDTLHPDRLVYGVEEGAEGEAAVARLDQVYATALAAGTPKVVTDLATAQLVKVAANSFLATKISFINEMANLCEALGADVQMVAKGIGMDRRIGSKFLHAGPGYGGSCFPKDTAALIHTAESAGYDFSLLRGVVDVNRHQHERIIIDSENLQLTGRRFRYRRFRLGLRHDGCAACCRQPKFNNGAVGGAAFQNHAPARLFRDAVNHR